MTPLQTAQMEVVADGRRLEVQYIGGSVESTPIVMLHEGLGSISLWRDFPAQLARRTRRGVIVYSRYGHGRSERLDAAREVEYMHREATVVLPSLLDALEIERPILFGHSDGGSIALIFGGTFPARTQALIVEAPHVFVEDLSVASITQAKTAYETTDLAARLARHHDDVDATFRGWNDIWLSSAFRSWNIERYLAGIRAPILAIQGEDDEYGTLEQLRAIERAVPATQTLVLEECGHSPHRDRRDAVLDAVTAFLEARD